MAKNFKDLSEQEILALAISSEETDARIYADFAAGLKADYPATPRIFTEMEAEEDEHRRKLIEDYRRRFGEHIPLIRREEVKGFVHRKPVWMIRPLGIKTVRRQAEIMETETQRFYERAASKVGDASTRKLLGDLAEAERKHVTLADDLQREQLTPDVEAEEEKAHRRLFVLQIVQPGLAGLMDGSVSTLAPVFAAAFATHDSHAAFLVGLAASVGAGISMGFAEAASDDGSLTGRGKPLLKRRSTNVESIIVGCIRPILPEHLTPRIASSRSPHSGSNHLSRDNFVFVNFGSQTDGIHAAKAVACSYCARPVCPAGIGT